MDLQDDIDAPDEAIEAWGENALTQTLHDSNGRPVHVPFYRTLHYPDVLDLRKAVFERGFQRLAGNIRARAAIAERQTALAAAEEEWLMLAEKDG